jgi:hypothetical protein
MKPRERILAILIGVAVGVGVLYQVVNILFISPVAKAEQDIANLEMENSRLDAVLRSRRHLADRWIADVGRTLGYTRPDVSNRIAQGLKILAKRHGFDNPLFWPNSTGSKIGAKTGITTVSYRVAAEGPYKNAIAFLMDIYKIPYFCEISRLSVAPVLQRNRPRDEVKIEFTVETPLLPTLDKKKFSEVAGAAPLNLEDAQKLGPARDDLRPDEDFALLSKRNIFRPYLPPPSNIVMIDNQDWKTVVVRAKFFWEGDVIRQTVEGNSVEEIVKTVPSKSNQELHGLGDAVEIQGTYADGKTFGPKRFEFAAKKDWAYAVAEHTPKPPPTVVNFAVDNQHADAIDLDIAVTLADGKTKNKPTVRVRGTTKMDIDEFEVKSLTATATYASGRKAPSATYSPSKDKQTYMVPVEPIEPPPETPVDTSDAPADPTLIVSGLVTYRDKQELIASAGPGSQRKVIAAGGEEEVDGGHLLGIHPLGGVVKMPSGNYYIYPLGRRFAERVKLKAKSDEELASAIDAWSRPEAPTTQSAEVPAAIEGAPGE